MITDIQGNSPGTSGAAADACDGDADAAGNVSTGTAADALDSMKTPNVLKCSIVAEIVRASLFTVVWTSSQAFEAGLYHFTVKYDVS